MEDTLFLVLLIKSDHLSRSELGALMSFDSMEYDNIKEVSPEFRRKVRSMSWQFDTQFNKSLDVNLHWNELKVRLPEPSVLHNLAQTCEINLFVRGTFYMMSPLVEFSRETLAMIASYGFGLGYDITDHTE